VRNLVVIWSESVGEGINDNDGIITRDREGRRKKRRTIGIEKPQAKSVAVGKTLQKPV
jgi:hypothetical protein